MIHPRVLFTGNPAAATPWVGIAKKLARGCYDLKISSKVYQLGSGVKIRVRNIFPIAGTLAGISKVWIEAGPEPFLFFSIYPKNSDNPYGWDASGNKMLYSGYQVGVSTNYRLWTLGASRLYEKKDVASLKQLSNQFYLSKDTLNISFYPGPQSDCPVLVYYAGVASAGKYAFTNEILKRIYEPFILFAGSTPPGGFPAAISQNAIVTYPLRSSYHTGYASIGPINFYLVSFPTGRHISLGCFKNGDTVYRIEAIPSTGITTSYVTVYFKYYIGDDIIQTIELRTLAYNSNPDLFPYKFNSTGTKFAHIISAIVDTFYKYQVVEYSINISEEGVITLTDSIIDESYYEFSTTSVSTGDGDIGESTLTETTTGTSPYSIFYDDTDDLQIASISVSITHNVSVSYSKTNTYSNYVYEGGEVKSYDYLGNISYDENDTTITEINIIVGANSYSISNYTDTIIKTTDHDTDQHYAYFGEDRYYTLTHTESISTLKEGYSGTLLAADAKNNNFYITAYDLQSSRIVSSQYVETEYTSWIYPPGFFGTPVTTLTKASATNKTQAHTSVIKNNDLTVFSNNVDFSYSSSNALYTDLITEVCPTNSSASDSYEIDASIMHGTSSHILNKDTFTRIGISYAGVNIKSGYHYIANIVGICPNGFASGIDAVANSFMDVNLILSSITNLQNKLPLDDVTAYPVSLYYTGYENLLPTPYE